MTAEADGTATGAAMVNPELTECCDCAVVETDSVETEAVENTSPAKLNADAVVEDLVGLTAVTAVERVCGKNDVENAGAGGEVVSKRSKSLLESWRKL